MKILSIDTSSKICGVCLLDNNKIINKIDIETVQSHSKQLMPIIEKIFKESNISLKDIDLIVCDKGPGSFTGIRIGIATVKAFCDSLNIPCIGVSSLEALAYNIKTDGLICPIIDCKNENCYFALYELKNNEYTVLQNSQAETIENMISILKLYHQPITFVGDGSIEYQDIIKNSFSTAVFATNGENTINSYSLAIDGLHKFKEKDFSDILPLYLRKPQVQRQLEEKNNEN